jgi:eukaryotic-like serine/threonine-protein kinase
VRPGRRGNRAVVVAVAVVALVLLAAAVFAILHSGDEPSSPASGTTARTTSPGTTTPVAPSSSPPPAIVLDPADYTGRPVDAVQAELTALHLQVLAEPVELRGVPAGRVVKVDPTGSLAPGSTVTVIFAAAPSPAPAPTHKDDGKGGKENPGHGKKDD